MLQREKKILLTKRCSFKKLNRLIIALNRWNIRRGKQQENNIAYTVHWSSI